MRFAVALLLSGCTTDSAFNPAGPQSGRITSLWWLFCWTCVAVYVLTMASIVIGVILKRRRGDEPDAPAPPMTRPDSLRERRSGTYARASRPAETPPCAACL